MSTTDPLQVVRDCFTAFATADRDLAERLLADDLVFSAPPDVGIDRAGWFARCWPGAGGVTAFAYVRQAGIGGGEVVTTYEATRADGTRFRNTEIHRIVGEQIDRIEVYFGWNLD